MGFSDWTGFRTESDSQLGGVSASAVVLVGANLLPLIGVFAWGWDVLNVVALYWLENVIIGAINVLKMLCSAPDGRQLNLASVLRKRIAAKQAELTAEESQQVATAAQLLGAAGAKIGVFNHASKLFLVPFFVLHYGFFCLGHGIFVFTLLGNRSSGGGFMPGGLRLPDLSSSFFDLVEAAVAVGGIWAALALGVSHLHSFFVNYLGKGEFRRTAAAVLMIAPYGRVIVLHLAILFGGFVVEALGSPAFLLVLLICGKIALDWAFHRRAHRKLAGGR